MSFFPMDLVCFIINARTKTSTQKKVMTFNFSLINIPGVVTMKRLSCMCIKALKIILWDISGKSLAN